MASNRMQRVEETLRRGVADVLLLGGIRDPRLQGVNFSITGVKVDTELTLARVFVDLLSPEHDRKVVLAGLRSAAGLIRRELHGRVHLRRIPELRFEYDESIQRGLRVETILAELRAEKKLGDAGQVGQDQGSEDRSAEDRSGEDRAGAEQRANSRSEHQRGADPRDEGHGGDGRDDAG
ncbi:MAG TPA: 30S ribosome-binding factor RbfA [Nannocystis sp.]